MPPFAARPRTAIPTPAGPAAKPASPSHGGGVFTTPKQTAYVAIQPRAATVALAVLATQAVTGVHPDHSFVARVSQAMVRRPVNKYAALF
ncbi:hypothetical protein LBMAG56_30430 [Verrucomicrobiota bacterium]|nr:hypothetical protein LBMAG56_30430 [Verrucomicrobiota bacterium]